MRFPREDFSKFFFPFIFIQIIFSPFKFSKNEKKKSGKVYIGNKKNPKAEIDCLQNHHFS